MTWAPDPARSWQKGIGEILSIQPDTIKKHRANILQKMQAEDLAGLIKICQGLDIPAMLD